MSDLEAARADFKKKDRRYHIGLTIFLSYIFILLTFVAIQTLITQSTIAHNQRDNAAASEQRFKRYTDDNAKQHKQTQQYILCIAQVLLLPIDQRTNESFDNCSVTGDYQGRKTSVAPESNSVTIIEQPPVVVLNQPTTVPTPEPTTSGAPPDDEPEQPTTFLQGLPLVGGLFRTLGL